MAERERRALVVTLAFLAAVFVAAPVLLELVPW